MNPNFSSMARCAMGIAYEAKESYPQAIEEFRKGTELSGSRVFAQFGLGRAYGVSEKRTEARQMIEPNPLQTAWAPIPIFRIC
jgi:hypothetical protein